MCNNEMRWLDMLENYGPAYIDLLALATMMAQQEDKILGPRHWGSINWKTLVEELEKAGDSK